ncbi:MAG: energy transducer TonB [Planctomycetota bacterium]|nr:energy transducer TonB [Planctomycetota bacterium]
MSILAGRNGGGTDRILLFSLALSLSFHAAALIALARLAGLPREHVLLLVAAGDEAMQMQVGSAFNSAPAAPRRPPPPEERRFLNQLKPATLPSGRPDTPLRPPEAAPKAEAAALPEAVPLGRRDFQLARAVRRERRPAPDEPEPAAPPPPEPPDSAAPALALRQPPPEERRFLDQLKPATLPPGRPDTPLRPPEAAPKAEAVALPEAVPLGRRDFQLARAVRRERRPATDEPEPAAPPPEAPSAANRASREGAERRSLGARQKARPNGTMTPRYPISSRRRGETGTVVVRAHISRDGQAREVRLDSSSGYPALDAAAIDTVRRASFLPSRIGGDPVAWEERFAFEFRLRQ